MWNWLTYTLIAGAIATPFVSAIYWGRVRSLRYLPIIYCVFAGVLIALFGQDDHSLLKISEIIVGASIAGCVFYFSVWIQCRS